jgi:ADP-heptose:LPS heptosyltransferase
MTPALAKLVGAALRLKFRISEKAGAVDVVERLAKAHKILIFMPVRVEHFGVALKALEKLREKRPNWRITVIAPLEMVSFIDSRLKLDILPYSTEDINLLGLPKNALKQHLQKSSYDLAIDFEFDFSLLAVKLFDCSGAPLRACFDSDEKSFFYNFGIRVNPVESLANKYSVMIKYITVIADSHPHPQALSGASF